MRPINDIEINELDNLVGYFWLSVALVFVLGVGLGVFIEHRVNESKQVRLEVKR
jgi:hypothetical protein